VGLVRRSSAYTLSEYPLWFTGETAAKKFTAWWTNDKCHEVNEAINGEYLIGTQTSDGSILTTDTNVHPDGDQSFWPLTNTPFIMLLSINADETSWSPFDFVAFYFDGSQVLYHIHLFQLLITGCTDQSRRQPFGRLSGCWFNACRTAHETGTGTVCGGRTTNPVYPGTRRSCIRFVR
jgi:hypothetical protein